MTKTTRFTSDPTPHTPKPEKLKLKLKQTTHMTEDQNLSFKLELLDMEHNHSSISETDPSSPHQTFEPEHPLTLGNRDSSENQNQNEQKTPSKISKKWKICLITCGFILGVVVVVAYFLSPESFDNFFGIDPKIPKGSMSAPIKNSTQITSIAEAYSSSANCPWGFKHDGVDFFGDTGTIFTSSIDGTVKDKDLVYTDGNVYQVRVFIGYKNSNNVGVGYNFEPFSGTEAAGNDQWNRVIVDVGDKVSQDQIIGTLLRGGGGAHIHWDIHTDNAKPCPEPYLLPQAVQTIRNLINSTFPGQPDMCYS